MINRFGLALLAYLLFLSSAAHAEEILPASLHLVRDISGGAGQKFTDGSNPRILGSIHNSVLFVAYTNVSTEMDNDQLWYSDGSASGASVLPLQPTADLPISVYPESATQAGEFLYFAGATLEGIKLWRTSGDAASTAMVFNYPGENYSGPGRQIGWQNTFYFASVGEDGRYGLYKVDNAASQATRIKRFERSLAGALMRPVIMVTGASLFYILLIPDDFSFPQELWVSDGTEAGTRRVKHIEDRVPFESPKNMVVIGDTLYYVNATLEDNSFQIWKSNGDEASTEMIAELAYGTNGSAELTDFRGQLYFTAADDQHGGEIWTSDGTITGTVMLQEIHPGIDVFGPTDLYVEGDYIYFRYPRSSGSTDMALWRTDGTASGAESIESQILNEVAYTHVVLGDSLYYYYDQPGLGRELWRMDLNGENAQLVVDVLRGRKTSIPNTEVIPVVAGDRLFFPADDGVHGNELWTVDSVTHKAALAVDVNKRELTPLDPDPDPNQLTTGGDRVFFTVEDGFDGEQLWFSDGSDAGTQRVENAELASNWGAPRSLTKAGSYIYFLATSAAQTPALWRTDGTDSGTALVMEGEFEKLTAADETLFFIGDNRASQSGLWRIEPDTQTPVLLHETGTNQFALPEWVPTSLTPFDGLLYFQAATEEFGSELWRSDGTSAGTVMVADQAPGAEHFGPENLTAVGNTLFFTAYVQRNGMSFPALWRTDGTAAGMQLLKVFDDLSGGNTQGGEPTEFTSIGNLLFFALDRNGPPPEVWRSDGTPSGTTKLATVSPPDTFLPYEFTNVGGLAYFVGASENADRGIWRSDGTPQGTQQILIFPFQGGAQMLTAVGTSLFFRLRQDATGTELWMLNQQIGCLRIVTDIYRGTNSAEPVELTLVGQNLFFVAEDGKTGGELYVLESAHELDCNFPYSQYLPFTFRSQ